MMSGGKITDNSLAQEGNHIRHQDRWILTIREHMGCIDNIDSHNRIIGSLLTYAVAYQQHDLMPNCDLQS